MSPHSSTSTSELTPDSWGFISLLDFFWALYKLWRKTNYKPSKPFFEKVPLECRQYSEYVT
jgi:hypothetical protein